MPAKDPGKQWLFNWFKIMVRKDPKKHDGTNPTKQSTRSRLVNQRGQFKFLIIKEKSAESKCISCQGEMHILLANNWFELVRFLITIVNTNFKKCGHKDKGEGTICSFLVFIQ